MEKELIELLAQYFTENSLWGEAVKFAEEEGYSLEELGFPEELMK